LIGQSPDGLIATDPDARPMIFATAGSQGLPPYCLAGWMAEEESIEVPLTAASLEVLSHLPIVR
jgi:hypothetical protein